MTSFKRDDAMHFNKPSKQTVARKLELPEPDEDPLRDIEESFGVRKPAFLDETLAPAVDHALILRLVRGELSDETTRTVHRLVISFKSWNDAYTSTIVDDFKRKRAQGDFD